MEAWRLIQSWEASPEFNMGLDEALLDSDDERPVLRLYSWSPDTLSLGYFQAHAAFEQLAPTGAVVRRITGGGAIHHTRELTFSIAAPASHALYRGPLAESYRRVHEALFVALRRMGVEPALCGAAHLASDIADSGMCFHKSTALDIVWNGRKGVGSAQRRRGQRVLHHGSIKLGRSPLEREIACLADSGHEPSCSEAAGHVLDALTETWDVRFEAQAVQPAERERALVLGARYSRADFVTRR
jgi:lipoate-protein ligase A